MNEILKRWIHDDETRRKLKILRIFLNGFPKLKMYKKIFINFYETKKLKYENVKIWKYKNMEIILFNIH